MALVSILRSQTIHLIWTLTLVKDDGTISVSTTTINEEKDAVLVEVDGFTLDDGTTQAVLLTKDNCVELIRALSTAASLLR